MDNKELDVRSYDELEAAYHEADKIVLKKYMNGICNYPVKEIENRSLDLSLKTIRLNKVDKLVFNKEENNQDKLMNVYNAVGLTGGSIINLIISDGDKVDYYIGTRTSTINEIATSEDVLCSSMMGNFPGSTLHKLDSNQTSECIENIFGSENKKNITVVSGIPGYRNKDAKENEKYIQGIERVIDSMKGKAYVLLTISQPVKSDSLSVIKGGYEELYTRISAFSQSQISYNESESSAVAKTITDGFTKTVGESLTKTISHSYSVSDGSNDSYSFNGSLIIAGGSTSSGTNHNETSQSGDALAEGTNESSAEQHSVGESNTSTDTHGRSLQITIENKAAKDLMETIDKMIKRIDDSLDLGLWNTATYCISDNAQTSKVLGSAIEAICRGEKNSVERFTVESWDEKYKKSRVEEYLKSFIHPIVLVPGINEEFEINPSSLINGKELVIEAGLPQKSLPGVPVSEMIPFSRNVTKEATTDNKSIVLGNIYHMGQAEKSVVDLDLESLSSHVFITGSTGSGKSNTVYHILSEIDKNDVKFLIVEPAKGEYKNVFGNRPDVTVYGTNDKLTPLLRIDPFRFPKSIHVLEHVDRLIEIFNVCWPMYAAMPAVLKEALLGAYERCGWNLEESENEIGEDIYPSFKDLLKELTCVISRSAYSEEVKGNYIGSLVTRVKSLTNGINGKLFTSNSLNYEKLYDENVIIDLSRVGSAETKSLIMGLVVMGLNEYRIHQASGLMNQNLRHLTVLEEAHNLLKNSSTNDKTTEDGGNLAGKSVEMIANSIAEMRTFGEGFVIVDQSPSAVDMSAIRNTNTKIIMRLPEDSDRKQAGKSAALKDKQLDELAKLKRGVAAVYQNDWLDPVLCMIKKADVTETPFEYEYSRNDLVVSKEEYSEVLKYLMLYRVSERIDFDIDTIMKYLDRGKLSTKETLDLKKSIREYKEGNRPILFSEDNFGNMSEIVVDVLECGDRVQSLGSFENDCLVLQEELDSIIKRKSVDMPEEYVFALSQCIIRRLVEIDSSKVEMYSKWREFVTAERKWV